MSDYITVTKIANENCLNINNYIGSSNVSKTIVNAGVSIKVSKIHMYKDNTVLEIIVRNNSKETIIIDTKEKVDNTYLYDTKGVKYIAFLNENSEEELKIRRNMETKIDIKFNKMYNPTSRELGGVIFKDVVLNYEKYLSKVENKNNVEFDIEF